MGPTWGRQDPGGPHVGPMNLAIRVCYKNVRLKSEMAMPIEMSGRHYLWSHIVPLGCDLKYTYGLFRAVVCICITFGGTTCILTHTLRVCSPRHWDNHTIEFCPSTNGVTLMDMGNFDEYQNKTKHNQTWAMYMKLKMFSWNTFFAIVYDRMFRAVLPHPPFIMTPFDVIQERAWSHYIWYTGKHYRKICTYPEGIPHTFRIIRSEGKIAKK